MVFEFDIEVRPEFDLPQWKGLKLERPTHEYTDEEVDERLQQLLVQVRPAGSARGADRGGRLRHASRCGPSHDGQQISQLTEETIEVKPTLSLADAKLEGFDKLLVGKQAGDTVDDEAHDLRRIGKRRVPRQGSRSVAGNRHRRAAQAARADARVPGPDRRLQGRGGAAGRSPQGDGAAAQVLPAAAQSASRSPSQLTVTATWDLPQDLLRRQARRELDRAVMELQSSGFSNEQIRAYMNELQQNAMASTARALKEHFILERIAEDEKIEAEPDDYDKRDRADRRPGRRDRRAACGPGWRRRA